MHTSLYLYVVPGPGIDICGTADLLVQGYNQSAGTFVSAGLGYDADLFLFSKTIPSIPNGHTEKKVVCQTLKAL